MNGARTEEAAVVRPMSVVQPRNTRLSMLSKRKGSDPPRHESTLNGVDAGRLTPSAGDPPHQAGAIRSLPQQHSAPAGLQRVASEEQLARSSGERRPSHGSSGRDEQGAGPDSPSMKGSVRKRLSMLKLGKKSSRTGGLMGSLDEE